MVTVSGSTTLRPRRRRAFAAALLLALALSVSARAVAQVLVPAADGTQSLGPVGTRWSVVRVDDGTVDLRRTVAVGDRAVRRTHVVLRLQGSGTLLQRNADGYYVPWDGDRATLADAGFRAERGQLTFKILAEPVGRLSLPLTVVLLADTAEGLLSAEFDVERP